MLKIDTGLWYCSCYEGDVVNGLRHGIGTFTDKSGFLSYTGEWDLLINHAL